MPPTEATLQSAVIQSIDREAPDTLTLSFNAPFVYKPGQSIQILIPGDAKKRYYSISSSPTEKNRLAITIKAASDHALTPLLAKLKAGDPVQIHGPLGSFGLPPVLSGLFCFIAGGSGITPCRSMIKYLMDNKMGTSTWLFHSARTAGDLIFNDEFTDWTKAWPAFRYIATLTRPDDTSWTQETGRISETLLRKHLTQLEGHFFLCGPSAFVTDMESVLKGPLSIPVDHIRREQW
jgi:ferredoxin-NADP reductase